MEQLQSPESLKTQLESIADELLAKFPDAIKPTRMQGIKVNTLELAGPDIISCLVIRTTSLEDNETHIIVYRQGAPGYIKLEEVFYTLKTGTVNVQTWRHNESSKAMLGFGTKHVVSNQEATLEQIETVRTQLEEAYPNPNPQARI